MASGEISEFATLGDLGIDIFHRVNQPNQRRHRYECIATLPEGGQPDRLQLHLPNAKGRRKACLAAAHRLDRSGLARMRLSLADPGTYPPYAQGDLIEFLVYLDFLRSWKIAESEIVRLEGMLQENRRPAIAEISGVLRLLLDFNKLHRARPFIDAVAPILLDHAEQGIEDRWQNAGYSLRMTGDLQRRAGAPKAALQSYEAALKLGENAHRLELAIFAARDASDAECVKRLLVRYKARWPLPERLEALARPADAPQISGAAS